ncbi:STM3941 family protein [Brevundimonas sp.]|uniref:STM3941 family protein n=1 Tax=Brevundimonas sp. TaxID=1871086 RepID=UPI00262949C2|nr:STM3941 family protein [Brevundimonas sp.]
MTRPEPRLVFQGSAWKSGLRAFGSLVFVGVGILLWSSDHESSRYPHEVVKIISIVCIGFFGLNAALSFYKLFVQSELILTAEGFSVRGLRKQVLVRWGDVLTFDVIKHYGGSSMVGYVLKPEAKSGARDRALTKLLVRGFDGTIAVFPEETPARVASVLDDWRRQYAPSDKGDAL